MKPLNLLMFLLGLSLAFVPLSYAVVPDGTEYDLSTCSYVNWGCYGEGGWSFSENASAYYEPVSVPCPDPTEAYKYYSCSTPPEALTDLCDNGVPDSGEEGIDCGGSCSADCELYCPYGSSVNYDSDGVAFCAYSVPSDSYGNCPSGYIPSSFSDGSSDCLASPPGDTPFPEPTAAAPTSNPFESDTDSSPVSFTGGSYSSYTDTSTSSPVDNGDGTSTTSTTTNSTNADGSTSTTTTSTTYNNSTGAPISSTTSTSGVTSVEENPENYDLQSAGSGDFSGMALGDGDIPAEDDYQSWFDSQVSSNPVVSAIESLSVTTSAPVCSIQGVVMGQTVAFSMCGDLYTDTFSMMGNVLVFLAGVFGYFIIVGRD